MMKKNIATIMFFSLLTTLNTGCVTGKAMARNIATSVLNNTTITTSNSSTHSNERSICSPQKGWQVAYVKNYQADMVGWLQLRLVRTNRTIETACDGAGCDFDLIGKKVKVKLDYVEPLSKNDPSYEELAPEHVDGCWVDKIKVLN